MTDPILTPDATDTAAQVAQGAQGAGGAIEAFAFGDPVSVLDNRDVAQFFEVWHNGRWYEPPMPMASLASTFNMSPHHRSAIALKINMLVSQHVATRWISSDDFERFALDFLQMGNGYLEMVPNNAGRPARFVRAPALHMRAGVDADQYYYVHGALGTEHAFAPGRIRHLMQPDVAQEIYGLPEWLSALQSGLLSENATLFRRRYYLNGAHAGFIFYLHEPLADTATADAIKTRLQSARGMGNFKNLFLHIPNGSKDGVQIIPLADVAAKDEFSNVKNISRDDLLAAHRTPPQLIGVIPQNNGGFGNVGEARDNFYETEIIPIMRRMTRINDDAGVPVIDWRDYIRADGWVIHPDGSKSPPPAR